MVRSVLTPAILALLIGSFAGCASTATTYVPRRTDRAQLVKPHGVLMVQRGTQQFRVNQAGAMGFGDLHKESAFFRCSAPAEQQFQTAQEHFNNAIKLQWVGFLTSLLMCGMGSSSSCGASLALCGISTLDFVKYENLRGLAAAVDALNSWNGSTACTQPSPQDAAPPAAAPASMAGGAP